MAALLVGVIGRPETLNELAGIDVQASRQLEQVVEVQVAPAALDLAKECPVDAATGGEGFLAEALGLSLATDSFAKGWVAGEMGLGMAIPTPYVPTPCPERSRPMRLRPGRVPALRRSPRPNKEAYRADPVPIRRHVQGGSGQRSSCCCCLPSAPCCPRRRLVLVGRARCRGQNRSW